jgi:hypothetical protein
MSEKNCESYLKINVTGSGDYTNYKKSKAIYKNTANMAKYGGVYEKKSNLGQDRGIYTGDINVSSNKCLLGARSYNSLFFFKNGKYLVNPSNRPALMKDLYG